MVLRAKPHPTASPLKGTGQLEKWRSKVRQLSQQRYISQYQRVTPLRVAEKKSFTSYQERNLLSPFILSDKLFQPLGFKNIGRTGQGLSKNIYEDDPLTCPRCQGQMRIVSLIEDQEVTKKVLKHLGPWSVEKKPSPRANAPPISIHLDYSACPGATRLPIVGLDYALFQT